MNEIITNPKGDMKAAVEIVRYINTRKAELLKSARGLRIDEATFDDPQTTAAIAELTDAVEDLREKGKGLIKAILEESQALMVITAIDKRLWNFSRNPDPLSAYGALKAELDAIKAKVAEYKAAKEPAKPTHDYVIRMTCTDAALGDILKYAAKKGATQIKYATPGNDKAFIALDKWMKENS